ncbi:MAG: hypothetical protein GY791_14860 [Alphaproteobacteria bacterium]|nr:hypothetical protein [Alphaproteobacteria bacterium]
MAAVGKSMGHAAPRWLYVSACGLVAIIIVGSFLFSPKREIGDCVGTVYFTWGGNLTHNCDSRSIAKDAENPRGYVADSSPWRTRPVYVFSLGAISLVTVHLAAPIERLMTTIDESRTSTVPIAALARYGHVYAAGFIFNGLVLWLAIYLGHRSFRFSRFGQVAGLIALWCASDLVAGWFWVTHSIFVNLLIPVGGLSAFLLGTAIARQSAVRMTLWGLLQSLAALTYGFALIWPILTGLGALWAIASWRLRYREVSRAFFCFALAFYLPIAAWVGSYLFGGLTLAHEIDCCGQFSWLPRALDGGDVVAEAFRQATLIARNTAKHLNWPGAVVAAMLLAALVFYFRGAERKHG